MVGAWLAFGLLALSSPETLEDLWQWVRTLRLAAEIVLWIATLPLMLGLAVWNSSWADWVQIDLIATFAASWTLASIPRSGNEQRGRIHWETGASRRDDPTERAPQA
jgi:hypothetical protein